MDALLILGGMLDILMLQGLRDVYILNKSVNLIAQDVHIGH